ncbi:MAG: hypothetical protein HDR94_02410 [Bacteroides sp.]|nr:hypothetical protein [Bacteroides sp.]
MDEFEAERAEALQNPEKDVTLQHGNRSEQDNDALSAGDDGGGVAVDSTGETPESRDRSDIRVYEEGLAAGDNAHSEYSERDRREAESERLVSISKQNDHYIDKNEILSRGTRYSKGTGESEVIIDSENGRVYKVKDPYAKSPMKGNVQPEDAIFEHLVHNKYFPETRYRFEGISEDMGDARIVLSQKYVESYGQPTQAQIEAALADKGLLPEGKYRYGNEEISVTDVSGDNALLGADGKVYFIDPIIDFKKPVKEILGDNGGQFIPENIPETADSSLRSEHNAVSAMDRVPKDAETGAPMFEEVDPETAWDALVEDKSESFADARLQAAEKELAKAQKLKNDEIEYFKHKSRKQEIDKLREDAQRAVDFWKRVKAVGEARAQEAARAEAERLAEEKLAEEERAEADEWIEKDRAGGTNTLSYKKDKIITVHPPKMSDNEK